MMKRLIFAAIAFMGMFAFALADESYSCEAELPRLEALIFESEGSTIYGQILVPSPKFGGARPCAIFCHGFAGFTRWDDVAHDLCRAGIAVVIPHHRGAWGSEGEYTVTGCIRDAENLAQWVMDPVTAGKYGFDANAVYLVGHSMGGNSVVNAASRINGVRGVALVAPCDIGFMAQQMGRDKLKEFLVGEGMQALRRASDDAVVDDIMANASKMRFTRAAEALKGKKVFLATAEYDLTVPLEPLNAFWSELGNEGVKCRRVYAAGHSLMGARQAFASDIKSFILGEPNGGMAACQCACMRSKAEVIYDAFLEHPSDESLIDLDIAVFEGHWDGSFLKRLEEELSKPQRTIYNTKEAAIDSYSLAVYLADAALHFGAPTDNPPQWGYICSRPVRDCSSEDTEMTVPYRVHIFNAAQEGVILAREKISESLAK